MKRKKGFYSISVVAKMFSVHQQTVRMYEKEGLISPKRTEGNTRLFSEEDVDRLDEIIHLTHKLGINLAGVQMILKLQKKIKHMQDDMNKAFDQMHGQLEKEGEEYKQDAKLHGEKLLEIKEQSEQKSEKVNTKDKNEKQVGFGFVDVQATDDDDWKIDYNEGGE